MNRLLGSSIVVPEHTPSQRPRGERFALGDPLKSSYCPRMIRELAGLRVHVSGQVGVSGPRCLVILLHGYGAPGTDLVSLASEIEHPPGTLFLFPEAPIDLALDSPELAGARAWWPIDVARLQVAMMTGAVAELAKHLGPGIASAVEQVANLVEEASRVYALGLDRIVLGGFSQGAIVSLEATLAKNWTLAGLLLFSGSYLGSPATVVERARAVGPTRAVLSHGQMDPILPFSVADRLQNDLQSAGWNVEWVPFLGGHGIPPKALAAAGRLVSDQLA